MAATRESARGPEDAREIHPTYLPFTRGELARHFAPVAAGAGDHLAYYEEKSGVPLRHWKQQHKSGKRVPSSCSSTNHQIEKDERFWVAGALMAAFHSSDRRSAFVEILQSAIDQYPGLPGLDSWAAALAEDEQPLQLFFEVSLPSPPAYTAWLKQHIAERTVVPWLQAAAATHSPLEGATKADAVLIAPQTGFAVVFEAKVLSDAGTAITYDATRNQIARNIDVLLDRNPKLMAPLDARDPDRTCFVLLTPEVFRANSETRLYGHLMEAYRSGTSLLERHLPHRDPADLRSVPGRLGWTSFEECARIVPGSCAWLTTSPSSMEVAAA